MKVRKLQEKATKSRKQHYRNVLEGNMIPLKDSEMNIGTDTKDNVERPSYGKYTNENTE